MKTGEAYGMISSHNTANSILGQVAVAEGDFTTAVKYLKNLIIAEPFGHIESELANSLISCGERDAVIEYLMQVQPMFKHRIKSAKTEPNGSNSAQFDKQTSRKIAKWIREIKSGKSPRMERC